MEIPRLAEDGDHRRLGIEQQPDLIVRLDRGVLAPRRAEGGKPGVPEGAALGLLEELDVARVRPGPSPFDEVDAERIELFRHAQLVGDGEGDPFTLGAVAEGGVVDVDA